MACCLWCGGAARCALLLLRVVLPLVEQLDLAEPAAMWISSRISASLWGHSMRFCSSNEVLDLLIAANVAMWISSRISASL